MKTISFGLTVLFVLPCSVAFAPKLPPPVTSRSASRTSSWQLYDGLIKGADDQTEEVVDRGIGGVRLAEESVIKFSGIVKHKPGEAEAQPTAHVRYTALSKLESEGTVTAILDKVGAKVLGTGLGNELYEDPGDRVEAAIIYAPVEAAQNAMAVAAGAIDYKNIQFNFLGGSTLILGEVMDAASEMVLKMDIATKATVTFHSVSHKSIEENSCSVTIVGLGSSTSEEEGSSATEKAIAQGEVYCRDGTWYTVSEKDINTAKA